MFRGSTLWQSVRKCPCLYVAKHEVKTWPLFGQLANLQRTIYIKRARGRHTLDNRDTMKERLVTGDRLVLFAEGTTGNGARQPFKSALFHPFNAWAKPGRILSFTR